LYLPLSARPSPAYESFQKNVGIRMWKDSGKPSKLLHLERDARVDEVRSTIPHHGGFALTEACVKPGARA
jgi:hypothetical protein